ncbi:MAG: group II intron reverse transcriptase domain-containing protein [Acidobacteria bacterium]|nr:group II intron reverse transcriptase domain-containing protein [Acidobacteriota bacterium]
MKRVGNLWPDLTSFANLLGAAEAAAAGKRKRPDVAAFLMNLEPELMKLQRELLDGSYQPGRYRTFTLLDPKPRRISAAPFRDRVIHHALTRMLEPVFERRFSRNSFACRTGMGTHKALERAREGAQRYPYVLKCDVRKYFASIDHQVLNEQLARVIKCKPTLDLAARIIAGSNPQEEVIQYFPGDNLFIPFGRRRGLPLGNQTSQFFANVYLNGLDRLIDEKLRPGVWVRYVDDLVLFDGDKHRLRLIREAIEQELSALRLTLNPSKSRIHRCAEGVTFLGWRLFPGRTRLVRDNVIRFGRRMKRLQYDFAAGTVDWERVEQSVRAWIAHASFGNTWVLRERRLERFAFDRGARPLRAGGVLQQ